MKDKKLSQYKKPKIVLTFLILLEEMKIIYQVIPIMMSKKQKNWIKTNKVTRMKIESRIMSINPKIARTFSKTSKISKIQR